MLVALYPSKKHCYQNPGNNQVSQILKTGGKLSRGRWFLPADLFRKSTSSETCYFKSDNPPHPKKKKTIHFPSWKGMSWNEPSKFAMQLPGASQPQVVTRDRSDLSAQRTGLDLSWLLGLHTSTTSPGSKYLSIFLSQSIVEWQKQEDEPNAGAAWSNQPAVSMCFCWNLICWCLLFIQTVQSSRKCL